MTNNEPINMTATNDRREAQLAARAEEMKNRWRPAIVNSPPPRTNRNHSVKHRSIR